MKTNIKTQLVRLLVATATVVLFLSATVRGYAIGPREALKEAYASLAVANHEYKGHRENAMDEVQSAGRIMGLRLRGEGRGNETDRQSDDHLRYARSMLQQARNQRDYVDKKDRDRVERHINEAIREINAALRVR